MFLFVPHSSIIGTESVKHSQEQEKVSMACLRDAWTSVRTKTRKDKKTKRQKDEKTGWKEEKCHWPRLKLSYNSEGRQKDRWGTGWEERQSGQPVAQSWVHGTHTHTHRHVSVSFGWERSPRAGWAGSALCCRLWRRGRKAWSRRF